MSNVYASTSANPAGGGMPGRSYKELAIWSLICAIWVFPPAGIIMGMIVRASAANPRRSPPTMIDLSEDSRASRMRSACS